jgi:hypothetical protein
MGEQDRRPGMIAIVHGPIVDGHCTGGTVDYVRVRLRHWAKHGIFAR